MKAADETSTVLDATTSDGVNPEDLGFLGVPKVWEGIAWQHCARLVDSLQIFK